MQRAARLVGTAARGAARCTTTASSASRSPATPAIRSPAGRWRRTALCKIRRWVTTTHDGEARIRPGGNRRRRGRAGRRGRRRSARREGRTRRKAQARRRLPLVRLRAVEDAAQVGAHRPRNAPRRPLGARPCSTATRSRPRDGARRGRDQGHRAATTVPSASADSASTSCSAAAASSVPTRSKSTAAVSRRRPSSSPPARGRPSRKSPASKRRPISPTRRCSICASPCPRSSSSARDRSAARWRRRSAAWGATSPSSTSRRASCRAKTPTSRPSCCARSKPKAFASGSAYRSKRAPAATRMCA